jgi:hypothetical protein
VRAAGSDRVDQLLVEARGADDGAVVHFFEGVDEAGDRYV